MVLVKLTIYSVCGRRVGANLDRLTSQNAEDSEGKEDKSQNNEAGKRKREDQREI